MKRRPRWNGRPITPSPFTVAGVKDRLLWLNSTLNRFRPDQEQCVRLCGELELIRHQVERMVAWSRQLEGEQRRCSAVEAAAPAPIASSPATKAASPIAAAAAPPSMNGPSFWRLRRRWSRARVTGY